MTQKLEGIHHVTAVTADAQKNIDFYTGVLGLRLVKLTVNFDDPTSYHLYYGDGLGRPGTIMTFFAWPGGYRGRIGAPQVTTTAFAIPPKASAFWIERLSKLGIASTKEESAFGEPTISLADPDGIQLKLVETTIVQSVPTWAGNSVPIESAIQRFHSVTLSEEGYEHTAKLLTDTMGLVAADSSGNRFRYAFGGAGAGTFVDLLCLPGGRGGSMGAGIVHHVAFRTPDDRAQLQWRRDLIAGGANVSPVMDRTYFHSIYYREPGGVLFEIATDAPGFTVDESPEELGTNLKLPPMYEPERMQLVKLLPALRLGRV